MITHRCKGSLEHRVSIRYQRPHRLVLLDHMPVGWHAYTYKYDNYNDVWFPQLSASYIKYCPYCGQELKERDGK